MLTARSGGPFSEVPSSVIEIDGAMGGEVWAIQSLKLRSVCTWNTGVFVQMMSFLRFWVKASGGRCDCYS